MTYHYTMSGLDYVHLLNGYTEHTTDYGRGVSIERADLLIAMRDHEHDWPGLPREPDLWVWNKCEPPSRNDRSAGSRSDPLRISALHASGLDTLASMVGTRLVSAGDIAHPGLWLFDDRITDG